VIAKLVAALIWFFLFIVLPALTFIGLYTFLSPQTFWERLVTLIFNGITCSGLVWIIFEILDRLLE